jgi:hypothetical protein
MPKGRVARIRSADLRGPSSVRSLSQSVGCSARTLFQVEIPRAKRLQPRSPRRWLDDTRPRIDELVEGDGAHRVVAIAQECPITSVDLNAATILGMVLRFKRRIDAAELLGIAEQLRDIG